MLCSSSPVRHPGKPKRDEALFESYNMTTLIEDRPKTEFSVPAIKVLLVCVLAMTLNPVGLLTVFSVFMQPMASDLGWSVGDISWLVTCLGFGSALISPVIGRGIDRFGPRPVLLIYSILYGIVVASLSIVGHHPWQLYAIFICIGLLNSGLMAQGRMIASWFVRQRGMAYGMFGFGFAGLTPVFLQTARLIIDTWGWRSAFAALGLTILLVVVPMIIMWFRDPQSSVQTEEDADGSVEPADLTGYTAVEAWTSRAYWQVVASLVLTIFVYIGIVTHGMAILTERGISRAMATTVLSSISIGTMVAQPMIGYLIDRFNTPHVVAPFAVIAIVGLFMLEHMTTSTGLIIAVAVLGLGAGGESGTTSYWVTRYFGLRNFSLIYGSIQPINLILATAVGPLILGKLYDRTGSYALNFHVMEGALIAAALLILTLPHYVYSGRQ